MDIQFTEEQELLRSSVQRLLRDQYDFDARRKIVASEEGFSRKQWEAFAELGLFAAPFSEDVGGLGGGPLSTMIIMQEFGRHLVVEPFVETVVLAGGLIENAGSPATEAGAYLPHIIAGRIDLGAGLGREGVRASTLQCRDHSAAQGNGLCSERRQGGGHRRTLGGLADRLGPHIGPSPRSRRRQPVRGRSPCGQSSPAELQDHRRPPRGRGQLMRRASPASQLLGNGRRGRRRAGSLP